MTTLFQLGVLLLFSVGAVQCKERIFSDSGLEIKTYEHQLQRGDEAMFSCEVCKKILHKIFKLVGKELSKNNVDEVLNNVCQKELKFIKHLCLNFIKKYKEKLVTVIMNARNAPDACKHLGLCKNSKVDFFVLKKF